MLNHLTHSPTKPKRVVIVGAGGFVGGAIAKQVREVGLNVLALGRKDVDLLSHDAGSALARLLRDDDAVVAASALAPCKNLDMLIGNMRIMQAFVTAFSHVKLSHVVNIGSDAIYADEPVPLTEKSPAAPSSYHGAMHLAREIAFKSEIKSPLAFLRATLIYGVGDPHNGYGPNLFRRLSNKNQKIVLFGAGEERRDHVFIGDVAELALRVLMHRSEGALNIASGQVHSFRAAAEMAIVAAKSSSAIEETKRSGPMPHNGYRPFDVAATLAAFPDFRYVQLPEGIERVQSEGAQ